MAGVDDLIHYGVPKEAVEVLIKAGVRELFEPQEVAVNDGLLKLEGSYLISVPTAGGKTLIAELLMVKSILDAREQGKRIKCLYVVPLRALASEKYKAFKKWEGLGISTGVSTGDLDSADKWLARYDIIVATSEKLDSLTRHNAEWLKDMSVLVVDEIHLIQDSRRGPTLEVVIARMRYLNPDIIVLGLSATVKNAGEIADWLDARLVESSWRPVKLREGIYYNGSILFSDSKVEEFNCPSDKVKEVAASLAHHTVSEGGQALVFSNTRRSAESFAETLDLSGELDRDVKVRLEGLSKKILGVLQEPTKTCRRLARSVQGGSAFHHAGLLSEQRRIVEDGFRENVIKIVSATPTLAAGVNLPARRVIIKEYQRYDVNLGRVDIPVLEYKQMAGRAGRPGYDEYGEALLIARSENEKDFILDNYLLSDPEEIYSKLSIEGALRVHVLSTIASNFANTYQGLMDFFGGTLLAHQRDLNDLEDVLERVLDFLTEEEMIRRKETGNLLVATPFGRRVARLYIDPYSATVLRDSIFEADKQETTPISYLHAISRTGELGSLYLRRGDAEKYQDTLYEHQEKLLIEIDSYSHWDFESLLSELKTASFLLDWVDEAGEEELRERYAVAPGDIRSKVDIAGWMLYSMAELAKLFKSSKVGEIKNLELRVKHGIKAELLELISLRGVGRVRARMLYKNGIKSIKDIRKTNLKSLSKIRTIGDATAKSIMEQVKDKKRL